LPRIYQRTGEKGKTEIMTSKLISFLDNSPSAFHAVDNIRRELEDNGFRILKEDERWEISAGGKYLVTRNDSALIAFSVPESKPYGYHIAAVHSDSPAFKIKENPEIKVEDHYVKLNVEGYGGMILSSWMDRPLSVAGRIIVKENGELVSKLVNVDRDLLIIPNLAIHMNREINKGYVYNRQKDMLPVMGNIESSEKFFDIIKDAADTECEILGHDLYLYNRQKASVLGAEGEFLASAKLDDLQCAYAVLQGFIAGDKHNRISVYCILDNEEVGSGTKQGAASTFLKDVLVRINHALGRDEEDYRISIAKSFMISADNAHAVHPNHADKTDPSNRPYINGGVVLKLNADQKYCTEGKSSAVFRDICKEADVPVQTFVNRSDMPGGSTLGNISSTQVAVSAVDIGLPQLAMHSSYELAGNKDAEYMEKLMKVFFK